MNSCGQAVDTLWTVPQEISAIKERNRLKKENNIYINNIIYIKGLNLCLKLGLNTLFGNNRNDVICSHYITKCSHFVVICSHLPQESM